MQAKRHSLEALSRGNRMLRTALGPAIAGYLDDDQVVEIMLNPDGRLWIDRLSTGLAATDQRLSAADGERIIRLVAHHVGAEVHAAAPRVSAELPETGERFEGLLPPVVTAPTFAIRKPAVAVFTLSTRRCAGPSVGARPPVRDSSARSASRCIGTSPAASLPAFNPSRRMPSAL
jgi:type IV secretion system protein VirB11